jgi:dihydroneopterin aldolase
MIVALHGAEFFAYHGFYPEEQFTGSCFIVDIDVTFNPSGTNGGLSTDDLNDTVNYEDLYDIACQRMLQAQKLIETVATFIIDDIKARYAFIEEVKVSIKKLNPIAGAKVNHTQITLNYSKEDGI